MFSGSTNDALTIALGFNVNASVGGAGAKLPPRHFFVNSGRNFEALTNYLVALRSTNEALTDAL